MKVNGLMSAGLLSREGTLRNNAEYSRSNAETETNNFSSKYSVDEGQELNLLNKGVYYAGLEGDPDGKGDKSGKSGGSRGRGSSSGNSGHGSGNSVGSHNSIHVDKIEISPGCSLNRGGKKK